MLTFSSPCKISVLENLVISMLRACVFKWLFLSLFNQIGSVSVILLIRKRSPLKRICFHSHKIIEMGKRRVRLVVFVRHGANIYNHLSVRKMDGFGIVTEWSCRLTLPMIFRRSNVLVVTMSASWWNIHQKTDQVTDWRNRARGSAYFLIGEDEHRADGAGNVARLVHWLSLEMKISLRPLEWKLA